MRTRDAIHDADTFSQRCLQFHQLLVQECGNETLITLVGMLESLYNQHLASESRARAAAGTFPGLKYRRRTLRSHEQLIELIDAGDADRGRPRCCASTCRRCSTPTLAAPRNPPAPSAPAAVRHRRRLTPPPVSGRLRHPPPPERVTSARGIRLFP